MGFDQFKGSAWFDAAGDVNFFAFPLFQVRQRNTYNLIVVLFPQSDSEGYLTVNVTSASDIQSSGQVSVLSIPPNAAFPLETTERYIDE
jgi:hypothetical protein